MKTGLIFDMDGTLWDSSEQVVEAWSRALDETARNTGGLGLRLGKYCSVVTVEYMRKVMGLPVIDIVKKLFPELSASDHARLCDIFAEQENQYLLEHGGHLYENVREVLEKLSQQFPLYIVSNCQCGYIETFLAYYRLADLFSDSECYGNTGLGKCGNIRLLAARNSLDGFFYIGDVQGDYEATIQAGGRFIHAAYGFGTVREKVPVIRSFRELPGLLKGLCYMTESACLKVS